MDNYVKIFPDLFESSLWAEADHVLRVWLVLLGRADQSGFVKIPIPGLAQTARVTIQQAEDAIEILGNPDQYSRSPDEGGRRIVQIEDGIPEWKLVNYEKYRERGGSARSREQNRDRQRRFRERKKDVAVTEGNVTRCENNVTVTLPLSKIDDRRKKKDTEEPKGSSCPATSNEATEPEPVLVYPTVGDQKTWNLIESKLAEYQELYPDLDVLFELKKAKQWIIDNPGSTKTAKGMTRYLNGWMARAQNKGAGRRTKQPEGKIYR